MARTARLVVPNYLHHVTQRGNRRQKRLTPELANVYQKILHSYVDLGRSLSKAEMPEHVEDLDAAIDTLRTNNRVVFDENDEPVGAYPLYYGATATTR